MKPVKSNKRTRFIRYTYTQVCGKRLHGSGLHRTCLNTTQGQGPSYPDALRHLEQSLGDAGWRWINERLLCPDCVRAHDKLMVSEDRKALK